MSRKSKEFSLDKVLTMSARDYANSQRVNLNAYKPVGVHKVCEDSAQGFEGFLREVPSGAEAVVDFRTTIVSGHIAPNLSTEGGDYFQTLYSGTALVRKR